MSNEEKLLKHLVKQNEIIISLLNEATGRRELESFSNHSNTVAQLSEDEILKLRARRRKTMFK